ncbi:hypothetical protein GCM10009016_35680 [Halomonas beimenensis]
MKRFWTAIVWWAPVGNSASIGITVDARVSFTLSPIPAWRDTRRSGAKGPKQGEPPGDPAARRGMSGGANAAVAEQRLDAGLPATEGPEQLGGVP